MEITLSKKKKKKDNFQLEAPTRPLGFALDDASRFLMRGLDNCYPRSVPYKVPHSIEILEEALQFLTLLTRFFFLLTCSHMF